MAYYDQSTAHYHNCPGIDLLNAEGTALLLPAGSDTREMGLIFALKPLAGVSTANNLLLERWLVKDGNVRVTVLPTSGDLQVLFGSGGDTQNQVMTYDRALMESYGWTVDKPQVLNVQPISAVNGAQNNVIEPQVLNVQPISAVNGAQNNVIGSTTSGYQLRAFLNGKLLPEKTRATSGTNPSSFVNGIGGYTGTVLSDITVFEFYKLAAGPFLSAAQLRIIYNNGMGCSLQRQAFLPPKRFVYYIRFSSQFYNAGTLAYTPLIGTSNTTLFSVTYNADYEIKTKLKLDGLSATTIPNRHTKLDRLNRTGVGVAATTAGANTFAAGVTRTALYLNNGTAGHNAFTYELDVQPQKAMGITLTQASVINPPLGFNNNNVSSILPGNYNDMTVAYELTPFLMIGTDGVIAGLMGYGSNSSRQGCVQLVWQAPGNLSTALLSRLGLIWDNRIPQLYLNANPVQTGVAPPPELQPGAVAGGSARAWPIRPYLQIGEPLYGANSGVRGGGYMGFLANISIWNTARHAYMSAAGTAPNKTNAATELELCWALTADRTGPVGSANGPTSLIINDSSGKGRHGVLTNYDLTAIDPQHRQRRGRNIISL